MTKTKEKITAIVIAILMATSVCAVLSTPAMAASKSKPTVKMTGFSSAKATVEKPCGEIKAWRYQYSFKKSHSDKKANTKSTKTSLSVAHLTFKNPKCKTVWVRAQYVYKDPSSKKSKNSKWSEWAKWTRPQKK